MSLRHVLREGKRPAVVERGVLGEQIRHHGIGVSHHNAGDDQQQRPKEEKKRTQEIDKDDIPVFAAGKGIKQVAEVESLLRGFKKIAAGSRFERRGDKDVHRCSDQRPDGNHAAHRAEGHQNIL